MFGCQTCQKVQSGCVWWSNPLHNWSRLQFFIGCAGFFVWFRMIDFDRTTLYTIVICIGSKYLSFCHIRLKYFFINPVFLRLGKAVGGSPWITILISLLVVGACLVGLVRFTQESRGEKLWTPGDSQAQKHKEWVDDNFPTDRRVTRFLLVAGDVLTPAILKEVSEKLRDG